MIIKENDKLGSGETTVREPQYVFAVNDFNGDV